MTSQQLSLTTLTDTLPGTSEQTLSVKGLNQFIHVYSIEFQEKGFKTIQLEDLLKDWIPGKGRITLIGMEANVYFEEAKGAFMIAVSVRGTAINSVTDMNLCLNRRLFAANAMQPGTMISSEIVIPEGMTDLIYPMVGQLPLPQITFGNLHDVAGNCQFVLKVMASGPYIEKHTLSLYDGSTEKLSGKARR